MRLPASIALLILSGCATTPMPDVGTAQVWLTTADQTRKLSREADALTVGVTEGPVVTVDPARTFQSIQGFGAAITDASAELIDGLPSQQRAALMSELFGRENGGLGLSLTRLTVGASDFSVDHYSYDDSPENSPDPELNHFSIDPAKRHVLPVTRMALAVNRDLKVMITPWSAPAWMKTSNSLIAGRLKPEAYSAFARYLARTAEAFGAEGVPVSLLSIQNEPDFEPKDYPGMRMSPVDRAEVIGKHVGPLFEQRGIKTQILDWDHNWDKPEQPLAVLSDPAARRYISGVAWHCYGGDVSAQEKVRAAYPEKDVWFTECSGGEWAPKFDGTLGWMVSNLIIKSSNSGSRGTLLWNMALDPAHGPHKGGCGDCRGVVTIDPVTANVTRNVEYFVLGHASRFVRTGATRIAVTAPDGIEATGFANPDGTIAVILLRTAMAKDNPLVELSGRRYQIAMPVGAVATVVFPRRAQ